MFECDPNKYPIQQEKMIDKSAVVISEKVTPDNILSFLKENNTPLDLKLIVLIGIMLF